MSNVTDPSDDALLEPEAPLWHSLLVTVAVCGVATVVFMWAAGHYPNARLPDEKLAVAECWDAIERQSQPAAQTLHAMRVACQKMESVASLAAANPSGAHNNRLAPAGQTIAMGE